MSHATYGKLWAEANAALSDLYALDVPPEKQKPERDRQAAFQLLAAMFIKYIQIFRRLEQCYDQMVHPQKRRTVRKTLDGVIGRVLELKGEMINLDFSEFQYFDDVLSDLKLTPSDIEMPIPKYFVNDRSKLLKEREKFLAQVLTRIGFQEKFGKEQTKMNLPEAILKIQAHERARQGRFRARIFREIKEREERSDFRKPSRFDGAVAAIKIQKIWRGFVARARVKRLRSEEFVWLNMEEPALTAGQKNSPLVIAQKVEAHRRVVQEAYEHEYQHALVTIKERLLEKEGPSMKETMQDQIRQWFIECRDATGKFPQYPGKDEGGSAAIFKTKDPADLARRLARKDAKKGSAKGKSKKGKKGKGKKGKKSTRGKSGKKGKKGKGKGKKDDEEEEGWKMQPSQFVPLIQSGTKEYESMWRRRNEKQNFTQKHDIELIKEDKRGEVEDEVRAHVDELMRHELKNLKMSIDRDKRKEKKKRRKKKKKKGKRGKKRKEKDLTPNRTIESLFEELVTEGVIVKYPKVNMKDYLGEYSYLGTTLRQANIEPMPSLADVRRVVTEIAILPLGSDSVHKQSPVTRSLLLAGPRGTGKNMLVHAICTETGATLFDLTATNLAGKFPGKQGLKMLLHLIFKVGRALQPSIFLVDEAERMFKKKIPKTDVSEPKRLRKQLPKALKSIGPNDRIMLIGCSRCPWDGDLKPMFKLYERILVVPRPDYASRHLIWRALIQKHNGILTNSLDITSLTKVSDGYTMGHIEYACSQVLTERRVSKLNKTPLQAVEFVTHLAKIEPVYKTEEISFSEWYAKTPLGRKRARAAKAAEEEAANAAKAKKKGKKGNGGKKK